MKEGSLHTRSFRRIHLPIFRYRWSKSGFTGPKTFRGFRETGPRTSSYFCVYWNNPIAEDCTNNVYFSQREGTFTTWCTSMLIIQFHCRQFSREIFLWKCFGQSQKCGNLHSFSSQAHFSYHRLHFSICDSRMKPLSGHVRNYVATQSLAKKWQMPKNSQNMSTIPQNRQCWIQYWTLNLFNLARQC